MYLENPERYDELECIAADVIEDYGICRFPLDIVELIEGMGVPLMPYSGILDQTVRVKAEGVSPDAFHIAPANYDITRMGVYYDPHPNEKRIRMSLAHELAHILCEHPSHEEPYESEAKYLASYLLAPTPLVIECTELGIFEIMDTFDVSYECAKYRLGRANSRIMHGAAYREDELRIIESCREWMGGEMKLRMKRGA